uniref:RNA-directed DNA polymerase, eukaryota n=1 Tax=Tanacetum cinerariifolium TaxID=118510 RepID=A0A699IS05_TANCI|nr:RNA-directed DNA polymerase, eukaryota [Tanacetum cinerariifolium]
MQAKRYGSIFNVQGTDAFNSFILAAGLEEIPLREQIRVWIKDKKENANKQKKTLKEELSNIDSLIDKGEGNFDVLNKRDVICKSLQDMEKLASMEVAQKYGTVGLINLLVHNGFTFGFFRRYWNFLEKDVVQDVYYFFQHRTFPKGSNSSFIALIPKIHNVNMVKDFRPITLIGSLYKIIAKILANRLVVVLEDIVNEVRSAFVAHRQILYGPLETDTIKTRQNLSKNGQNRAQNEKRKKVNSRKSTKSQTR